MIKNTRKISTVIRCWSQFIEHRSGIMVSKPTYLFIAIVLMAMPCQASTMYSAVVACCKCLFPPVSNIEGSEIPVEVRNAIKTLSISTVPLDISVELTVLERFFEVSGYRDAELFRHCLDALHSCQGRKHSAIINERCGALISVVSAGAADFMEQASSQAKEKIE